MKKNTTVAGRDAKFDSTDIHEALFPRPPKRRSLADLRAGIVSYMKRRHPRR